MQKKMIITGIFLVILILSVSLFLSIFNEKNSPDTCPPPPTSIFRLVNKDINQSHSVSVIINNESNTTLARESYYLAPGETTKSTLMLPSQTATNSNLYYLIFTVDGSAKSEISVYSSFYTTTELHVDPVKKEVEFYSNALTGDYACRIE